MRPLVCLSLLCLGALSFAAAPPARVPAEWLRLIDQLGDDDEAARTSAGKKLTALGEDALPALRAAGGSHPDADVRLRASVLAAALEKSLYGEVRKFTAHATGVSALAVSPDGKRVVTSCSHLQSDRVARVWDVRTGKELLQLEGHTAGVSTVAWSSGGAQILPGGKRFVSSGFDGTVRVFEIETGKQVLSIDAHAGQALFVAVSPDGRRIASGGEDHLVKLWDAATGKRLGVFRGHTRTVHAIAYSGDGRRLLSGGYDGTARLWDVATGAELQRFSDHEGIVTCAAFLPGDRMALTAAHDKTLRIWKLRK